MELHEDVSFEEYLARALPEDVTTETFLDPLSLGGLPGKGAGAMGHPEVRSGLSSMRLHLKDGRGDASTVDHRQRRIVLGLQGATLNIAAIVESAAG